MLITEAIQKSHKTLGILDITTLVIKNFPNNAPDLLDTFDTVQS